MLCSSLHRVVKVGRPQFIRSEVCKVLCFKALASFYSRSLFLWARCCCSYPRGNLSSFRGNISETSECKKEKTDSPERDQPAPTKVQKLGAPLSLLVQRLERASSSLASPVLEPEQDSPSLAEVPPVLGPLPSSDPIAEAGNPSGEDGVQLTYPLPSDRKSAGNSTVTSQSSSLD